MSERLIDDDDDDNDNNKSNNCGDGDDDHGDDEDGDDASMVTHTSWSYSSLGKFLTSPSNCKDLQRFATYVR